MCGTTRVTYVRLPSAVVGPGTLKPDLAARQRDAEEAREDREELRHLLARDAERERGDDGQVDLGGEVVALLEAYLKRALVGSAIALGLATCSCASLSSCRTRSSASRCSAASCTICARSCSFCSTTGSTSKNLRLLFTWYVALSACSSFTRWRSVYSS